MLHVSNVSLNTTKKTAAGSKFKVFAAAGDKKFLIASLQEGHLENYQLDLYFRPQEAPTFSVSGGGASVHVTGYWEVAPEIMDDYGMGPLEMDMDEEEEADLDPVTRGNISKAKENALRNAQALMDEEDDEDEDDDEDYEFQPKAKAPAAEAPKPQQKAGKQQKEAKKPVVEEDSDEDESKEDVANPVASLLNKNTPAAAEELSDDSESDAPQLVPRGGDDEDSEDSDEFDVKEILANKKRKAQQAPEPKQDAGQNKRQKVNEGKEKPAGQPQGGKPQHKQGQEGTPQQKAGQDGKQNFGKNKNKKRNKKNKKGNFAQ
mmetsp:Transcript_25906/g.29910  ORF Transcript_25906/g.29910 Transcript_25906/m.29910 type:complete len:318 (-) Transcript_25906:40-993(-)